MNTTADDAITGAIATVKKNSSKINSVKIKIKFDNGEKKLAAVRKKAASFGATSEKGVTR